MPKDSTFNVVILTPERLIYEGKAKSLILPGEKGVFEVLPFHKQLLSRLIQGQLVLDGEELEIRRGVAKVGPNEALVIVEEGGGGTR